ncbi:type I methionyl aminopeptidase [Actinobacteria bacterium YIM 96077]|uniref:Methionine aminopeptidase n=1 Tax=Phytoactinopolyspora halophila TaxID=1981511 RepID=A0A329QBA5_9ACTN|nr:type I methionyl aminopeptidase [Phytoactinopolyspora halophila]AYY14725.1 type I methionyl aminopeptidase [Actinobacteria bacterium YIM 96077]RAW09636.1 type I methionyl aminopeptidase [Phytoactinopolyspora halophila]
MRARRPALEIKSDAELVGMRAAGMVVAEIHAVMREAVTAGTTGRDLDALARRELKERGATSNFLGYHGFPATVCVSVNDVVVHGIPNDVPFRDGDIVSIDFGAVVDGWHGDAAVTLPVGDVSDDVARMLSDCEDALWAGIAAMRPGRRLREIGTAVERLVQSRGDYGIVEEYGGHGIGTAMHQDPHVMNYRTRRRGPKLQPGLCLAVEPMITLGDPATYTLDDDWTVKTTDGAWAAHFEHSVAVTSDGPYVLTALDPPSDDREH